MKILHVIPSVSASQGGPSRALADMECALAVRGLKVTTATTNDDGGSAVLDVPLRAPVREACAVRWYFPRDTVFYKVSFGLARWLKHNIGRFDIVHVHALFSFAPLTAAFLARQQGVPYVIRPLGVLRRYGMQKRAALKSLSWRFLERGLLESAAAVHFTSRQELEEAEALGLVFNGVVIPLGVDAAPPVRRDFAKSGPLEFLFLSRIDPVKNLEGLLRGFAMASVHNDMTLKIAGEGDAAYLRGLKKLADELGIAPRTQWLGHLAGDAKQNALARADVFVQPSLSESFGIAVVEALASGLPCLVSRGVAIQDEIAGAGAGLVVDTDAASIAAGLSRFAAGRARQGVMSAAARKLALEVFSTEAMGARLENLYRGLVTVDGAAA